MKNKLISWLLFIVSIFLIWDLSAIYFNNAFILPYPNQVIITLLSMLKDHRFYISSIYTIIRVLISIIISLCFGFTLAFICNRYHFIESIFSKLLLILRTLPNVTIIILLLFWIPREWTVLTVSFLLLFPIIYEELYNAIVQINTEYKDLFLIYKQPFFTKFKHVYLPLMKFAISSSLISAGSLCFKVTIMAEILAQVSFGIGRRIQVARLNVELHEVMAWTIWIIIFVFIFDKIYRKIIQFIFN